MRTDPGSGGHIMFPDCCQSVLLAFGQRTHISHDHHSRGQCCSSASIAYDVPCMGVISYQKTFASALMLSLNLLAFLFHTVLEWSDDKYALLRQVLARRKTFFHDIQALMRYMVFDSWDHLMDFMIRGLELASQVDTS